MTEQGAWAELERRGLLVAKSPMEGVGSIELKWPEGTSVEAVPPDGVLAEKAYLAKHDDGWIAVAFTPLPTRADVFIDHLCVAESFEDIFKEVLSLIGAPVPSAP